MSSYPARPVKVEAKIPAAPEDLFRFVSDTRNDALWCSNVSNVDLVAGDGSSVGTRFRFDQTIERGRKPPLVSEVETEVVDRGENWVTWRVVDRFQDREITLRVDPAGTESRITQVTRASFHKPPGLARHVYPFLAKRTFREQFRQLSAYLSKQT